MSIEVKPLTPAFGAEIEGVDLASSSAADFDEVLEIFSKYGVIFFRDQNKLSEEAHINLARRFGEIHMDFYSFVEFTISSDACILSVYWSRARMMLSSCRSL